MKRFISVSHVIILSFLFMFSQASWSDEQTWKVNLKDADIRAFVTQVSDITGYSFVIDPRVKGKVTVISNAPMDRDAVYEMFLSVLQVHGFSAIPSEGVIKIVQQNEAKQKATNLRLLSRVPAEQLVTRVIQVKNANALELVPILRPMVAKYGHLAGVAAANALIISDHISNIKRISSIIDELDSPSQYELEVVQLDEAWVGDMVKLLEELAPSELGKAGAKASTKKFSVVADERSNRLIIKGDENFRTKIKKLIAKLDQPAATLGTTKVVRLKHADAKEMAELLKGIMGDISSETKDQGSKKSSGSSATVYADEGINALVIRAEPSVLQETEAIIRQLDVRRAQVLIEAAIVEIGDENTKGLGVQWALYDAGGAVPGALTNFGEVGVSAASVLSAIAADDPTAVGNVAQGGLTMGIGQENSGTSWGALIQALDSNTDANLLSTPKIITMDNQESSIIVGQNIPIKTGESTTAGDGTSNPFTTITREDIGVKLVVTPSISEGDLVRLEITQEISSIADSVDVAADIVTQKREIKTNVLADDGETIVLGGLITEDYRVKVSKVPLLGDIPWVGALFRSTENKRQKRNLLIFLRPTILRDKLRTKEVTEEKFNALWELNLGIKEDRGRIRERSQGEIIPRPAVDSLFEGNRLNDTVQDEASESQE
ncbi:type II secretion system secretin GspD [Alkalimarinus sediminis]|uniref:Type II secretion system secretin GspD n=1 Tax=Alkalimarinus sediminis TaxID=1632866 RepID=A0A9E8KQY0_9ALTE|nr:type II secretion system secretin GspD [Alkalimarinus sediminis]UZW75695.1 type II secretion system secretin GspD [Alkalimarinus sediminis]